MSGVPRTLDFDQLTALRSLQEPGQPDVLAEMIALFVNETSTQLATVTGSTTTVVMQRAAHSLRGSCGAVGAERMVRLAEALEEKADQPWAAAMLVPQLVEEFWRVRELLNPYRVDRAHGTRAGTPAKTRTA